MSDSDPILDPLSSRWIGVMFTNPLSGETIEVVDVDREDEVLRGRLTVRPGGIGPPRHVHPDQEEHFSVESGELTVHLGGNTDVLTAGRSVTVPAQTPHGFENRSDQPVVFIGTLHPGDKLVHALATMFGLARDGKVRDDGTPRFMQAMVFAQEMRDVIYLASPPRFVQQLLWTAFAPLGRGLGYQATYDRYLTPGFWAPVSGSDGNTSE